MRRSLPYRRSSAALKRANRATDQRTIIIALVGDVVIAVGKLVAGLLTGSAAMLAESGHSFADLINEVFLAISVDRSRRPADAKRPFGYGREKFLWAFMATISSFIVGGCLSIGLAVREFETGTFERNQTLSWIVLGIALLADGASWLQSSIALRQEAREHKATALVYLKRASDPILRAIVVEDWASMLGIGIAALGLVVSRLTKSSTPDAIASLSIGVLLAFTAIGLARPLADFLVGRSLPDVMLDEIHKLMVASPGIESVVGLQAVYTGPEEVIVAAKIRPSCSTVTDLATEMDKLDHQIREAIPLVADVFVDVTLYKDG